MTASPISSSFYITGGTLSREASSYVVRQADTDLYESLLAGEYCYVLNSRQMGKSSLCVRTRARLQDRGVRTAFLDLTKFGSRNLTAEQWYLALLSVVGRELDLRQELVAYWKEQSALPPLVRFFDAIRDIALPHQLTPLVVFVDEIDVTLSLPFNTDEFFAAIRQCYIGRSEETALNRLTFCLLGTATPADLIQDTRTSPFNIGKRIEVRDFTAVEAVPLARGLGKNGEALLSRVLYWTGGHPYLTQRLCRSAAEAGIHTSAEVDTLCANLFLTHTAKESDDNLSFVRNRLLRSEVDLAALLDLYRKLRSGKRIPYDETNPLCPVLRLSGVAAVRDGILQVRNRIYDHVFDRAWVEQHMPDAELRRQKQAFRRGLLLAGSLSGIIVLIMASLAAMAIRNARLADHNATLARAATGRANLKTEEASVTLYAANMGLIQRDWDNNAFEHVHELLEATRERGRDNFEWNYWNRLCHLDLLTLQGHTDAIFSVAFSLDGKRVVTGSYDKTAKVWDAQTGKNILTLKGHTNPVSSVAFSPDGKRVVTGSYDNTAKIWDAVTGREMLTLKGHPRTVTSVAFSPDGKRVVTGSWDKTAKVWDAVTGRDLLTLKGHVAFVYSAAFSSDGKRIVTGSPDKTAKVWDAQTGKNVLTLKGHTNSVFSVAFSPDGKRIVTGSWDKTAKVWDAVTGRDLLTLKGHTDGVFSSAFSPDGKRIVTGNGDNTAKVWDGKTGDVLLILKGHGSIVYSAAFSADGRRIVTGSDDKTAKIWDAVTGHEMLAPKGHPVITPSLIEPVAFSPDGKRVVTLRGEFPKPIEAIYETQTGKERLRLLGHSGKIWSVAFSPDGKRVVTGSFDKTAKVWDAVTGRDLLTLKGHSDGVSSSAFSPDGKRIVTGSYDKSAKVWDAVTGKEMLTLTGHTGGLRSAAFSPDGRLIVTSSMDKTAKVWNAQTGKDLLTLRGHTFFLISAAFSPDGKRIVTGSRDRTAKVWDTANGHELLTLRGHTKVVNSLAFSPDGKRIVTGSGDNTAKVWDAQTGTDLLTLKGHASRVNSVTFSQDGTCILSGNDDTTTQIWFADDSDTPLAWRSRGTH
jgi:WD40 repeat protein